MFFSSRDRSQRSRTIRLRGGRIYFIEVVMKEGGGGDHLSVGVRKPGSKGIKPVSKRDLYQRPPSKRKLLFLLSLLLFIMDFSMRVHVWAVVNLCYHCSCICFVRCRR